MSEREEFSNKLKLRWMKTKGLTYTEWLEKQLWQVRAKAAPPGKLLTRLSHVIVAEGEGAGVSFVKVGDDLREALHCFMCCCGKPVSECQTDCVREAVAWIDDDDNWCTDEDGKPFSISWDYETGQTSLYVVRQASTPALPAQPDAERTVEALRAELAREREWRKMCIIEIAVENQSVADYIQHWEGRTLSAEARVSTLEEALRKIEEHAHGGAISMSVDACEFATIRDWARTALSTPALPAQEDGK